MKDPLKGLLCLLVLLSREDFGAHAPDVEKDAILEILDQIKSGIATGFQNQWEILQRLRFQGIKRHQDFASLNKAVRTIVDEGEKIKGLRTCPGQGAESTESLPRTRNAWRDLSESPSCPNLFKDIQGECVYFGDEKKSWGEAIESCRSMGGHLYNGRNITNYNLLRSYLMDRVGYSIAKKYVWIGGRFVDNEWKWIYKEDSSEILIEDQAKELSNFTSIESTSWANSEPRILTGVPLCMALDSTQEFKAVAEFCRYFNTYLCSSLK